MQKLWQEVYISSLHFVGLIFVGSFHTADNNMNSGAELPGFYYDAEKNRYFPTKGPIPGSRRVTTAASSSNAQTPAQVH